MRPTADAIVVLGARVVAKGLPSWPLRCRAEHGARLYLDGRAPLLLLSGGRNRHDTAEAHLARDIALSLGVPAEAIALETRSRSTHENAIYCAEILRERSAERILLVTDPSHLFRARREFERAGIRDIELAPALESEAGATRTQLLKRWTSEALSIARRPWLWLP